MIGAEQTSWSFYEWLAAFLAPLATGVFGHVYHRLNTNDALIRRVEHELRNDINLSAVKSSDGRDDLRREIADGRDDLRREIQSLLQAISLRLDQTPTKHDMMDMISLVANRK